MCEHDPEAVYQEADILQADYERQAAISAANRRRGICSHGWHQGFRTNMEPYTMEEAHNDHARGHFPDRPIQGLPTPDLDLCLDCGALVEPFNIG